MSSWKQKLFIFEENQDALCVETNKNICGHGRKVFYNIHCILKISLKTRSKFYECC